MKKLKGLTIAFALLLALPSISFAGMCPAGWVELPSLIFRHPSGGTVALCPAPFYANGICCVQCSVCDEQ